MNLKSINALGLISGTSMDGIDCSLIKTNGINFKRANKNIVIPYSKKTSQLLDIIINKPMQYINNLQNKDKLEALITNDHINAVNMFRKKYNDNIEIVGFHGQTILHQPKSKTSIQIGDGKKLAHKIGLDVISNFREYDIINGGQGAPLAPVFHQAIMKQENIKLPACFINIGGVSNLTWWNGKSTIAFDTGPGNGLIDTFLQNKLNLKYDNNGYIARKGNPNYIIINKILNDNYFKLNPPKSIDRLHFNKILNLISFNKLNIEDAVATLACLTVQTIIKGYEYFVKPPNTTVIMGGGQHNKFIVSKLKEKIINNVFTANEIKLPGDFIEAELIAFIAVRRLYNLPITFPSTTGVNKPIIGGIINKFI